MFPETFVRDHLLAYSSPGDLVLDPFSGRGTTLLEGLLLHRRVIATDVNYVAACVSGTKADVPSRSAVLHRISFLRAELEGSDYSESSPSPFFDACFSATTLNEIMFLRSKLAWRVDPVDRFIAALALSAIHGESHRSQLCLSNRMPRTISTKPDYSIRWWQKNGYTAPVRRTFSVLERLADLRFSMDPPSLKGQFIEADARRCSEIFRSHSGQVKLVITSPPYLDVTDYAEDQWLRLWFLGGRPHPCTRVNPDDRHTVRHKYWKFLEETWTGLSTLLSDEAKLVIRIGGKSRLDELTTELLSSLERGLSGRSLQLERVSSSAIRKRQTNVFRPGTSNDRQEHDFVISVQNPRLYGRAKIELHPPPSSPPTKTAF